MRPQDAKSDFAYDPLKDEWCILYPVEWIFHQHKTGQAQIKLIMDFTNNMEAIERMYNFSNSCRANGDRLPKLFLKTVGLQMTTYALTECSDIDIAPVPDNIEAYEISFQCIYYDQFVKVNPSIRVETFKPFQL